MRRPDTLAASTVDGGAPPKLAAHHCANAQRLALQSMRFAAASCQELPANATKVLSECCCHFLQGCRHLLGGCLLESMQRQPRITTSDHGTLMCTCARQRPATNDAWGPAASCEPAGDRNPSATTASEAWPTPPTRSADAAVVSMGLLVSTDGCGGSPAHKALQGLGLDQEADRHRKERCKLFFLARKRMRRATKQQRRTKRSPIPSC